VIQLTFDCLSADECVCVCDWIVGALQTLEPIKQSECAGLVLAITPLDRRRLLNRISTEHPVHVLRWNGSALRLLIRAKCHSEVNEVTWARVPFIFYFVPCDCKPHLFLVNLLCVSVCSAINCDLVQYLWSHAPRFGWRAAIKRDSKQVLLTATAQRKSEEDDSLSLVPGGASSVQTLWNNTAGRKMLNLKFIAPLLKGQIWRIWWRLFNCGQIY
jgi:hypothetical protein